jgi:hypothetical protein
VTHSLAGKGSDSAPPSNEFFCNSTLESEALLEREQFRCRARGRNRVRVNDFVRRTWPGEAPNPLGKPGGGPGQIEMNQHARILKVQPFADQIRREQEIDSFARVGFTNTNRVGSEPLEHRFARNRPAGDARTARREKRDARRLAKARPHLADSRRVLRTCEHRNARVGQHRAADHRGTLGVDIAQRDKRRRQPAKRLRICTRALIIHGGDSVAGKKLSECQLIFPGADPRPQVALRELTSGLQGVAQGFGSALSAPHHRNER